MPADDPFSCSPILIHVTSTLIKLSRKPARRGFATMNRFLALLLAAGAYGSIIEYTAIDDPRCHDEPSKPVIPPTKDPKEFPPIPVPNFDYPKCEGGVTGFQIWDQDTNSKAMDLEYGSVVKLSDMPKKFTVRATTKSTVSEVKLSLNGVQKVHDTSKPFDFTSSEFDELYIQGIYKLSGHAKVSGTWEAIDESCTIMIEVDYNNPTSCPGIVQNFALWDVDKNEAVPGYEILADGQELDLAALPPDLTIKAVANGRGSSLSYFWTGTEWEEQLPPYSISGLKDGKPKIWTTIRETGSYKITAKLRDRLNNPESDDLSCSITINVVSHHECPNYVTCFTVIDALTDKAVPGYDCISGNHVLDLDSTSGYITVIANGDNDRVSFYLDGNFRRDEGRKPQAINGKNGITFHSSRQSEYNAFGQLSTPGTYVIEAYGKKYNEWDTDACGLTLTTVATDPPTTPSFDTEGGEACTPAQVKSEQEGGIDFLTSPLVVEGEPISGKTVFFKVKNTILQDTIGWVTPSFVSGSGVEVCDKNPDMAFEAVSEHTYEAKCFDGFAFVDLYAYSDSFPEAAATADTSLLPLACKNDFTGKVVKYTFVLSCDCENVPDVPPKVAGKADAKPPVCVGETSNSWGDPHVISYNGQKWDCQEEGEFVLTKAELAGHPYDFELRSRFTKFGEDIHWSFNSGMVAAQDVKVEISFAGEATEKSNMFSGLPVNFYVDGQKRWLHQGSGDHRVQVSVDGYNIHIFFTTTGISIRVLIRPISVSGHITSLIPGSMSTYICMPDDNHAITNIMGLTGSPEHVWLDSAGNKISSPSNKDDFCVEQWCVKDETDSLFTFEEGTSYTFDHYNGCTAARRQLKNRDLVEVDLTWSEEHADIWEICGPKNDTACLLDGITFGPEAAKIAAESLWLDGDIRLNNLVGETESGCCSSNFKDCIKESDCPDYFDDKFNCGLCVNDNVFTWLEKGSWGLYLKHPECAPRDASCEADADCCPGASCENKICLGKGDGARRLSEPGPEFVRMDLGETRNIVALSEL